MPDLLAHALVAYTAAVVLSWRYEWISPGYATVAMVGAMIPDLAKAELFLPSGQVEAWLGIPFDWFALHTAGGTLVVVLIIVVLVASHERTRIFLLLTLGAATHHLTDALLLNPSGRSYEVFWPLTRYHPPTPGLYLSTEPTPTIAAAACAFLVWAVSRHRQATEPSSETQNGD